jgi:hypothetical protein
VELRADLLSGLLVDDGDRAGRAGARGLQDRVVRAGTDHCGDVLDGKERVMRVLVSGR